MTAHEVAMQFGYRAVETMMRLCRLGHIVWLWDSEILKCGEDERDVKNGMTSLKNFEDFFWRGRGRGRGRGLGVRVGFRFCLSCSCTG